MINIAYKQAKILHQFKESKEFIETMVKRLKMSKINMTFQINLYKIKTIHSANISTNHCITLNTFFRQIKLIF